MRYRWLRKLEIAMALVVAWMVGVPLHGLTGDSEHWPSFRGPRARGVADGRPTPTEWSLESGENLIWKTPIPGLSHSSAVIWGDRICVTSAVREGGEPQLKVGLYGDIQSVDDEGAHRWTVSCLDKSDGKTLW